MRLIILFLLLTILTGCNDVSSPRGSPKETVVEKEIISTVQKYISASAVQNWDETFRYLCGEALNESKQNLRFLKQSKTHLESNDCRLISTNNRNFAEVYSDVTIAIDGRCDRRAFRYQLIKDNNRWFIYKVAAAKLEFPSNLNSKSNNLEPENTVRQYLEATAERRWIDANNLLTGPVYDAAVRQQANLVSAHIKPGHVSKINSSRLATGEGMALIETSYILDGTNISAIFQVVQVPCSWKIVDVSILSSGKGGGTNM